MDILTGHTALLAEMRNEVKAELKEKVLAQFVLSGVIVLLAAINPEAINALITAAIEKVGNSAQSELRASDLMDNSEFAALMSETRAEIIATFTKIRAFAERVQ